MSQQLTQLAAITEDFSEVVQGSQKVLHLDGQLVLRFATEHEYGQADRLHYVTTVNEFNRKLHPEWI
jgi:hypothetical protein